jgi:hypothetical protein
VLWPSFGWWELLPILLHYQLSHAAMERRREAHAGRQRRRDQARCLREMREHRRSEAERAGARGRSGEGGTAGAAAAAAPPLAAAPSSSSAAAAPPPPSAEELRELASLGRARSARQRRFVERLEARRGGVLMALHPYPQEVASLAAHGATAAAATAAAATTTEVLAAAAEWAQ